MNIAREKFYTIMKPLKCYTMNEKVLQLERYEVLYYHKALEMSQTMKTS